MSRHQVIRTLAWALAAAAFAGSYTHGRQWAAEHGSDEWAVYVAALPEIMVLISVLKIMDDRRDPVAWIMAGSAVAFTLWANGAAAAPGLSGMVVALWPAYAALLALGTTHQRVAGTGATVAEAGAEVADDGATDDQAGADVAPPLPPLAPLPATPAEQVGWLADAMAAGREDWRQVVATVWSGTTLRRREAAARAELELRRDLAELQATQPDEIMAG